MMVRSKSVGQYGGKIRELGEVFEIQGTPSRWMEPVEKSDSEKDPKKSTVRKIIDKLTGGKK